MADDKKPNQKKSPLQVVNDQFGGKAKLLEALGALVNDDLWLPRTSKDRGGSKGLARVSNAKLVRLHKVLTEVKEQFGTREKLITSILEVESRPKDEVYKKRVSSYPAPRLLDLYKSAKKRAKAAGDKK